jgi:hypothetical protein
LLAPYGLLFPQVQSLPSPNCRTHYRQTQRYDHSYPQPLIHPNKQEGGDWLTWVFAAEDISKVEEKFGRSAIEGHRTRPDGSDLKWKQIGVNEITDSRELPFFIQWLTADHPSQDGKAVAAIEKITIADTDHLADSWFKSEILGGLNGADVEFIDPSTNDGEYGIVAVHLTTPTGSVVLD